MWHGWHKRFQLVLPDINSSAIPWNVYIGDQQEWMRTNSSALSVELVTGFKGCPDQQSVSGLMSLRLDGTVHTDQLFGLEDGWYSISCDGEYYPRDRG